ncbi:hypothetical protein [Halomonas sp. MCCC 1A11057]|jgi:hypothetical protein|uniref:hypothetical protein n=1 Tax=Halomonas sp. MCCC 1A11057 TaxID=2733482 RepID=UPI001F38B800|nr:hypothetical protein [Halomonas sp. MCCC 1A11057]MCE8035043.1 hypothetical protein [Halomonas sp. MCCC 1A11057]
MKWKQIRKGLTRGWRSKRRGQRQYHVAGLAGFEALAAALAERDIDHLFLHWPGAEVAWPGGEEIVLLVADEGVPQATALMRPAARPGDLRCTLYSVGGLPGSDRNRVAYLPVRRARELLASMRGRPAPRRANDAQRLLAVSAEAVYHLGLASSLPTAATAGEGDSASPLASAHGRAIVALDERCGLWSLPHRFGLEELEARLTQAGWAPLTDTLFKLSGVNPWLKTRLQGHGRDAVPGLAVYLIRERGLPHLDALRGILARHGFDVLYEMPIDGAHRDEVADQIRGGNWGRGPFPCSGGLPSYLLVTHDVYPDRSPSKASGASEMVDNARVFAVKEQMRRQVNRGRPAAQHCNPVHSSDNAMQAMEYLAVVAPEKVAEMVASARRRNAAFATPYPVLADLSKHARRAKVELIDFHGRRAICKTFRPGRERFLEREVKARELGSSLPEVSRILEIGPSYLVFEWYEDSLPSILAPKPLFYPHGLLPIWAIERLRTLILHYRRLGYECIDFNPHNVIYDPCQGLKVIDFEYLQPGSQVRDSLKGNYAWYPVPDTFPGDIPPTTQYRPYFRRWLPYTGLPRFMCLYPFPRPLLVAVRHVTLVAMSLSGMRRVGWRRLRRMFRGGSPATGRRKEPAGIGQRPAA